MCKTIYIYIKCQRSHFDYSQWKQENQEIKPNLTFPSNHLNWTVLTWCLISFWLIYVRSSTKEIPGILAFFKVYIKESFKKAWTLRAHSRTGFPLHFHNKLENIFERGKCSIQSGLWSVFKQIPESMLMRILQGSNYYQNISIYFQLHGI